jgi:uncharacterized damage-inducible protein DinB
MTLTELLLAQLDYEAERSRRALAEVPDGKFDWKPHEKSMPLGYLTMMVAQIPDWFAMIITQDSLDLAPKDGPRYTPQPLRTSADLLKALEGTVQKARAAISATTDEHLTGSNWKLLVGGNIVAETSRFNFLRDTMSHLAHHRGQLTVYLRLLGAKVPSLYGPSADEQRFD